MYIDFPRKIFDDYGCELLGVEICRPEEAKTSVQMKLVFYNRNIFGSGEINDGVYLRFREFEREVQNNSHVSSNVIVSILPILAHEHQEGQAIFLPKSRFSDMTSALTICGLDKTKMTQKIFSRIAPYINYCLKRNRDGKVYILEQSMYLLASLLENIYSSPTVVDVGSGSGNLANVLLHYVNPKHLYMYEYDDCLGNHLKINFKEWLEKKITVRVGDCIKGDFPNEIDIICMSVNPDTIISFLNQRSDIFTKNFSSSGVALFFVGETYTPFFVHYYLNK